MPDDSWNTAARRSRCGGRSRSSSRTSTPSTWTPTARWPFGRRLEDQVATRFLSLFLDHEASIGGKKYHVETFERPVALGRREDRAEDPSEPVEERQGVPQGIPVPGGTLG